MDVFSENGDIVTSCGSFLPFCHKDYGAFFEEVAVEEGLRGWAMTMGGSSDTRIWTGHGIQSVNQSTSMQKYRDKVASIKAEEVWESKITLDKGYLSASTGDSALGNLIADRMKAKMDSDFALMNGGGVRANLNAGKVTLKKG